MKKRNTLDLKHIFLEGKANDQSGEAELFIEGQKSKMYSTKMYKIGRIKPELSCEKVRKSLNHFKFKKSLKTLKIKGVKFK